MKREEQIKAAAKKITGLFSYRNGYSTAEDAFIAGAEWADANPCMPDKVVKIPERSREEIKELLANWKGTLLVVGDDISPSPWISVEERLPEPEKEVIILNKRKQTDIDFLTDDFEGGYYWWKSDDIILCEDDEITHWMPIPELPKSGML